MSAESQVDISIGGPTYIIDLDANTIASQDNLNTIVDRMMAKDIRLGVNLRAQLFLMAKNTEKLYDEGLLSREQILERLTPKCNY
jgi:hypothetical protein